MYRDRCRRKFVIFFSESQYRVDELEMTYTAVDHEICALMLPCYNISYKYVLQGEIKNNIFLFAARWRPRKFSPGLCAGNKAIYIYFTEVFFFFLTSRNASSRKQTWGHILADPNFVEACTTTASNITECTQKESFALAAVQQERRERNWEKLRHASGVLPSSNRGRIIPRHHNYNNLYV